MFIRRLFYQVGAPWEAETRALKSAMIESTEAHGGRCAVSNCVRNMEQSAKLQVADENFEGCPVMIGFETET
ncbi:hypothetical protein GGU10DRAFT_365627 [Lentinula aff. detonsa]|uniref:Uncharacterized protein n=1 Tax=Lentinula aff. detonsa TaxID=2804958 RepID=A0AA38NNW4_9AGAR|nr:hypothetical protein GGU10DRAFT_365627 [Lentinula aff. detonsa]